MDKQYLPKSGFITIIVSPNRSLELHEPKDGNELSVKIILKTNAQMLYVTGAFKNIQIEVVLAEQARFEQTFSSVFSEQRKQSFILEGKQSSVRVFGSYFLQKNISTFEVLQLHKAPQSTSSVELKTVLDGTAHFEYKGMIKIEQPASDSNAHQENKNLIVSDQAKALSLPSLEALNHNVQCGHGSAISYINQDHLFYLASRGVTQMRAKKIIINGFLNL